MNDIIKVSVIIIICGLFMTAHYLQYRIEKRKLEYLKNQVLRTIKECQEFDNIIEKECLSVWPQRFLSDEEYYAHCKLNDTLREMRASLMSLLSCI